MNSLLASVCLWNYLFVHSAPLPSQVDWLPDHTRQYPPSYIALGGCLSMFIDKKRTINKIKKRVYEGIIFEQFQIVFDLWPLL
jgi:hypothetical protein